jgi:Spondin_N
MKRLVLMLLAAATLAVPAAAWSGNDDDPSGQRSWRVTVTNLTPAGSQPLSPPLFVVHSSQADIWSVGQIATHPVAAIAEDANNAPAESALDDLPGVGDTFTGPGGPIPPGASRTYMVETRGHFNRLSVVTMLVNTNDGFTGVDSLRLRGHGTTVTANAYDAGSEANNEDADFIPGPCCGNAFVRDPEGELIRMHGGITGVGDLDPDVYDWPGAAARFRIERAA